MTSPSCIPRTTFPSPRPDSHPQLTVVMYGLYCLLMLPEMIIDLKHCKTFTWKRPSTLAKIFYVIECARKSSSLL